MSTMASQITILAIVYSSVYSGADLKTLKLRVTGLCTGNSPVTGEFPAQRASNAENISIWWRHHEEIDITYKYIYELFIGDFMGQAFTCWVWEQGSRFHLDVARV